MPATRTCPSCGRLSSEAGRYCPFCGTAIDRPEPARPRPARRRTRVEARRDQRWTAFALIALLLLGVIGGGSLLLRGLAKREPVSFMLGASVVAGSLAGTSTIGSGARGERKRRSLAVGPVAAGCLMLALAPVAFVIFLLCVCSSKFTGIR